MRFGPRPGAADAGPLPSSPRSAGAALSRAGQRPAELATVIADAASIGGPAVSFTIMHRDRDNLLPPLVLPSQTGLACRETLAFDLPPAGFRVQTGFAESPASTMAGVGSLTLRPCPGGYAFEGV